MSGIHKKRWLTALVWGEEESEVSNQPLSGPSGTPVNPAHFEDGESESKMRQIQKKSCHKDVLSKFSSHLSQKLLRDD